MMKKPGFSLAELIVGLGLFAVVSVTTNILLFSSLRGSRKAAAVAAVRSEGSYALNSMVGMIRYAQRINGCTSTSVSLVAPDGSDLVYQLDTETSPNTIASVSSRQSNLTSSRVEVSVPDTAPCGGNLFDCPGERLVKICFAVQTPGGADLGGTDKAGSGEGIIFQSQISLRN